MNIEHIEPGKYLIEIIEMSRELKKGNKVGEFPVLSGNFKHHRRPDCDNHYLFRFEADSRKITDEVEGITTYLYCVVCRSLEKEGK